MVSVEESSSSKSQNLRLAISEPFLRVFVRALSMQKGVLYDLAASIKQSLCNMIADAKISSDLSI